MTSAPSLFQTTAVIIGINHDHAVQYLKDYRIFTLEMIGVINAKRYFLSMIISFEDKDTEKIWNQLYSKRLPRDIQLIGLRKLIILHKARYLDDLRIPPGNRLEALSGNRSGQHSIRICNQWRICFNWNQGQIIDVEIVDYP